MSNYSNLKISKYVVAAICGNWWRESNCNPGIWESLIPCAWDYKYEYTNRGGYGLGQWTNIGSSHGRLYDLHEWLEDNDYADDDGYGELEYLLVENTWYNSSQSRLGFTSLTQFLEAKTMNLNNLVWDFLANWEGVPGDHFSERCGYARKVLKYINKHANDGIQYTWITSNAYLSESQILNNAMVIYQYIAEPRLSLALLLAMMNKKRQRKIVNY